MFFSKGDLSVKTLRADALQKLVARACERMGARPEDAEYVAGSLVQANLCGYASHGVFRLTQYHEWWKRGLLKPAAQPAIIAERGFAVSVDGRQAFGQVVARFATQISLRKARVDGIAVVTAKNNNHVGRLADSVEALKHAGLIGLAAVNDSGAGQVVVPWGGMDGRLSTNPIAVGIPGGDGPGILFDFSTSAAASGKVRQLLLRGEEAPDGWLVDASGSPTRDPASLFREPHGFLLPAGGHRGYALGLLVEALAGILSGAGYVNPHPGPEEMNGMFVLALDPAWFVPADTFRAQVDELTAYVKTSRPMPDIGPVHIPGERSRAQAASRERDGIPLDKKTCGALGEVLRDLALPEELPCR
jgi:LDH2 family malate/lactate/ureidoglycolate dehydrogenase